MHQSNHASSAAHVALHVLHVCRGLDGNAAGIEANALADKSNRLIAALAAVPAHDHGAAGLRRALRDTEQRAHSEFLHGLDVENLDVDTELAQLPGAARKFHGIENVGRLVDEVARGDDTIDDVSAGGERVSRSGHVPDGERNVGTQGGVLAILLFGLVAVEFIGAQPDARCDRGRLIGRHGPRRQFRNDRHGTIASVQLAGCGAAKLEKIAILDCRELASADHDQARHLEILGGQNIERGAALSLEPVGVSGAPD